KRSPPCNIAQHHGQLTTLGWPVIGHGIDNVKTGRCMTRMRWRGSFDRMRPLHRVVIHPQLCSTVRSKFDLEMVV
ncbi:MAG: hypothetical protein ACREBC_27800, partial [Pyrinomonadaceae bacterium]